MRDHEYCVYILANTFHRLYTGVTNSLSTRVKQHKAKKNPQSFTARYGINRLVYFERFQYIQDAIRRETQIKGLLRIKKIASNRSSSSVRFLVTSNPPSQGDRIDD